jgi:hypothetical protein
MMSQIVVNLLGGPEVVSIRQNLLHRSPLPRLALRTRWLAGRVRFCDRLSRHLKLLGGFGRAAQCSS